MAQCGKQHDHSLAIAAISRQLCDRPCQSCIQAVDDPNTVMTRVRRESVHKERAQRMVAGRPHQTAHRDNDQPAGRAGYGAGVQGRRAHQTDSGAGAHIPADSRTGAVGIKAQTQPGPRSSCTRCRAMLILTAAGVWLEAAASGAGAEHALRTNTGGQPDGAAVHGAVAGVRQHRGDVPAAGQQRRGVTRREASGEGFYTRTCSTSDWRIVLDD